MVGFVMSYTTVEVELDHGRVWPRSQTPLPERARALLTILEPSDNTSGSWKTSSEAGLQRFLSMPDFPLSPEQFRASMEADPFEQ
jgi:hypothetical protein